MYQPSANETWLVDAGDVVIQKKASSIFSSLSNLEKLIYCLWVADYGMRNAGDLQTAQDLFEDFQTLAAQLAGELGLHATYRAFALPIKDLEREYFERFEEICDEIQRYSSLR